MWLLKEAEPCVRRVRTPTWELCLVAGSYVNVVHMGSMEGVHHADLQIRCGSKPAQSQPQAARRSHSIESAAAAGTRRAQARKGFREI